MLILSGGVRQNSALSLVGVALASAGCHFYLRASLAPCQPLEPNPILGQVYPINVHGASHYLSAIQTTELGLLIYLFCIFFLAGALLTKQATQLGMLLINTLFLLSSGVAPFESESMTQRELNRSEAMGAPVYFFSSLLVSLFVLWFAASPLASLLVSKGIILNVW
jgi:hypothetical protein